MGHSFSADYDRLDFLEEENKRLLARLNGIQRTLLELAKGAPKQGNAIFWESEQFVEVKISWKLLQQMAAELASSK